MSESLFVLVFIWVSLCFAGNLSKVECGDFEQKNAKETTYGAYDGPSCLWRSVGGSIVQLLKEDGEVWPSVGLRSLWRSAASMTVHPAGSSWSSEKWSQYLDSKSWSILKRRPSMDRCAYDGPSYLPLRGMKRAAEEIAKYGTTDSMTVCRDHDGPSTQPCFGRFQAIRILVLLGFYFFYK